MSHQISDFCIYEKDIVMGQLHVIQLSKLNIVVYLLMNTNTEASSTGPRH